MKRKIFSAMLFAFALIFSFKIMPLKADLNDGLVAYYSFDNCDAHDDSGNGHDGIIHGNPECVDGIKGHAFRFGKSGNFISLDKSYLTDLATHDFSISVWINLDKYYSEESNSTHGIIIRKMYGGSACGGGYAFDIYYDKKNKEWLAAIAIPQCNPYNYNQKYIKLGKLSLHKYYMLTGVYTNDNKVKMYLNEKFIGERNYNGVQGSVNNTINLQIGQKPNDSYYKDLFPGIIDELRIYNRALSESEIKQLYYLYKSPCGDGSYNTGDYQQGYNKGFEAGKKYCKEHPSECGIQTGGDYDEGYKAGKEFCKNNPSACGITCSCPGGGSGNNCASFDFMSGQFYVPCFKGGNKSYWLIFNIINSNPVQMELKKFGVNK